METAIIVLLGLLIAFIVLVPAGLVLWMYHVIAHRPGGQPIAALEFAFAKIGKQVGRLIRLGRRRASAEGAA